MASCGLDRETGLPLTDLAHVAQCVETIFATRLGSMIMLRHFGGGLAELFGRRITPRLVGLYRMLLALAITLWEPRLKVVKVYLPGPAEPGGNTVDAVTLGQLRFVVLAYYRPRGHLGDLTIEGGERRLLVAGGDGRLIVSVAP